MRRVLIALAVALIPSLAIAHGHGGCGGGHMGAGWGGHMGGGWGCHSTAPFAGGARMGAWSGHMAAWNGGRMAAWNSNRMSDGLVVPAIGIAFITATLSIATDGFSSSAGLGGVVSATTTVVAGSVGPDPMGSAADLGLWQLLLGRIPQGAVDAR
jgi:hypothetical protein